MMADKFFVTGIGTGVGKTVISAIFCEALKADYWKPVQAGYEGGTDGEFIAGLTSEKIIIHPERYKLREAVSPHAAAAREGVQISLDAFQLPLSKRPLIVEGAGGILVPLNEADTMLHLMKRLALPVVLVSRHYLGSINHTLMSVEVLKNHGLGIAHLVFVGDNAETEAVIEKMCGMEPVLRVPEADRVDKRFVAEQAEILRGKISDI